MKKLITIAVVFALAMGGVFAADLGVSVNAKVNFLEGTSDEDAKNADGDFVVGGSFQYKALDVEGSGENDDGTFGAWYRFKFDQYGALYQPTSDGGFGPVPLWSGLVWWKPVDQFKLTLGGNPDGIYPKEGYSAWMFNQTANTVGVVDGNDLGWGHTKYNGGLGGGDKYKFRHAFYGGFDKAGLLMDIKPTDMIGINIAIPYYLNGEVAEIFMNTDLQLDISLDFGNIALTFDMEDYEDEKPHDKIGGRLFAFFDLSSVENLNLAIGFGFGLPRIVGKTTSMDNLAAGIAAKYQVNDAFGIKARVLAEFAGNTKTDGSDAVNDPFGLIVNVNPYFAINDSVTVFADIGITMLASMNDDDSDPVIGFWANPYVRIGEEWGPSFFAGFRLWTNDGDKDSKDNAIVNWEVPIGIRCSF